MELEKIKEYFAAYRQNHSKSEEVKAHLCDVARENPSDMWQVVFSGDKDLARRFVLLKSESLAQKGKENFLALRIPPMVNMTANLAQSDILNQDFEWQNDKHQVWLEVYEGYPDFLEALGKKHLEWKVSYQKMTETLSTPPQTVESYKIVVPARCLLEIDDIVRRVSFSEVSPEIFDDVMHLSERTFMPHLMVLDKVCHVSMGYSREDWIFTFDCDEILDETDKEKIKKKLWGWLKKAQDTTLLVGHMTYSVGFDL